MMYDFLFVYEVKGRELENICLLKYELERRGYTVKLCETWRKLHYNYRRIAAKVVITFAAYGNGQIQFVNNYAKSPHKIVNLQWEQLYTIADEEDKSGLYQIRDMATKLTHICWGQYNYNRLTKDCGINPDNALLAGHISMDFFKPRLSGYYLSREELFSQYNIELDKKVFLFISSFSYVDIPEDELKKDVYKGLPFSTDDMRAISIKSQREILDWFEAALKKFGDTVIIYRPHPAELGNSRLALLEKNYCNFKVIRDYSIKQWIIAADKIMTWYSTSVAEVYAAGKSCVILRPVPFPREGEIRVYEGCRSIKTSEEFLNSYYNEESEFPLNTNLLNYYYTFTDEYTYMRICDKLVDVLLNDKYYVDYSKYIDFEETGVFSFIRKSLTGMIKRTLAKRYISGDKSVLRLYNKGGRIKAVIERAVFDQKMIENNYATNKEIKTIQDKIAAVIRRNTEEHIYE